MAKSSSNGLLVERSFFIDNFIQRVRRYNWKMKRRISLHFSSDERTKQSVLKIRKTQRQFQYNHLTLEKCEERSIDLLVFIISKCSHASTRHTIRRTWAHEHVYRNYFPSVRLKFLFLVDFNREYQRRIELEHEMHHDIVQVINLPEQYEYVTYREAAMYTFVYERCQQIKFLLKTDDDIFLNLFLLLMPPKKRSFSVYSEDDRMIIHGYPIEHGLVVRSTSDSVGQRYVITSEEYACPRYPTFLSGFAYVLSYRTLSFLLELFQRDAQPFMLSDVYFTGLLPELFHIPRTSISADVSYLYQQPCHEHFFLSTSEPFACAASDQHFHSSALSSSTLLINQYNAYWDTLKRRYLHRTVAIR